MHAPARTTPAARGRAFLKWAGGKRQLLRELRGFVPREFGGYHEPFLGSGAMFFDLWRQGALAGRRCRLTDINADLVGCYTAIATQVDGVVGELKALAEQHTAKGADAYYRVRDELFNPRRRSYHAGKSGRSPYPPELAAMFIYLNRTGYNGLYRLNARGDFNVPAGRYANPRICDEDTLRGVGSILRTPSIEIRHESYLGVRDAAKSGDFVYFDPPYAPISPTARFTSYTAGSFSDEDQRQLHDVVLALVRRKCFVVLSNSTAPIVASLYDSPRARKAGLHAYRVSARRAINSKSARRGEIDEYVITNVPRDPSAA